MSTPKPNHVLSPCLRVAGVARLASIASLALAGCSSTPTDGYVSPDEAFAASGSSATSLIGPAYSVDATNDSFGGMYDARTVQAQQMIQAHQQQMAQTRQQALASQRAMMQWGVPQPNAGYVDPDTGAYAAWKSQNGL